MTKTLIGHPEPDPRLYDEHAERRLLGALLLYSPVTAHAVAMLGPSAFTTDRRQEIFQAAAALHHSGRRSDPITVGAELRRRETGSGHDDLHHLAALAPPQPLATYYLAIVRDLATLRGKPDSGPLARPEPQPGPSPEGMPPAPMRGFLTDEDDH